MKAANARTKILDTAINMIRAKGYAATRVEDLCQASGVTKTKEALGVAAAQHWSDVTGPLFASASYHLPDNPIDRIFAYVAFRKLILTDQALPDFTCLAGTMVQETFATYPAIREACGVSIISHAETLIPDIEAALAQSGETHISARSLALFVQSTLQGAFVVAKASNEPGFAQEACDHLTRYLELLFAKPRSARMSFQA
jgi:TetR/AcrR family transcriptional regulator, transcriptional repressor for nem operon